MRSIQLSVFFDGMMFRHVTKLVRDQAPGPNAVTVARSIERPYLIFDDAKRPLAEPGAARARVHEGGVFMAHVHTVHSLYLRAPRKRGRHRESRAESIEKIQQENAAVDN